MSQDISASDAHREFSRLLSDVRGGQSFVVMHDGQPVARIVPVEAELASEARRSLSSARSSLLLRLERQSPSTSLSWTRDELYEG